MIIYTTNEALAALLTGYSQHDGYTGYVLQPLTAQQLANLADVLTTKYADQWTVNFDGHPSASYEDLTAGVDGANWQALMLAPGTYGADTDDLINFIENVYGLPVDNSNHKQVAQMFRFWFAANCPAKYTGPVAQPAAKYAELSLTHPADSASKSKRQRERRAQAAQVFGLDTIDKLAAAVLSLSDEDAAKLRRCFEEVTRRS